MNRVLILIALGACLAVSGCAGGLMGTGVGDGRVSDFEAGALNVGGELAGVSGAGTKAQKILPPSRPAAAEAAAMRFQLLSTYTNHWDSKGTVTHPPYYFRIDPDFGSITGRYGAVSTDAKQPAIDPAVQAAIEAAVKGALAGAPSSGWIGGGPKWVTNGVPVWPGGSGQIIPNNWVMGTNGLMVPPPPGAGDDDQRELDEAEAVAVGGG